MTAKKSAPPAADSPQALAPKTPQNAEAYAAARTQSSTAAASKIRDAHREEHDEYMAAAMAERGFLWEPRPTGKRAALLKMSALAAEYGLSVQDLVAAGLVADGPAPAAKNSDSALAEHAAEYGVEVHDVDPDAR